MTTTDPHSPYVSGPQRPERCVIVSDDLALRLRIAEELRRTAGRVPIDTVAYQSLHARALAASAYDCVLLVLSAPRDHESPIEAIRSLREQLPQARLVAVSIAAAEAVGVEALKAGADEYWPSFDARPGELACALGLVDRRKRRALAVVPDTASDDSVHIDLSE
jgi:DNA-binding NarL/FixJ family response regulator